jgi:S-adenosylmethionine:tRNA ribosyltransferase-isomerase
MDVSLFDFELPGELIALRPAAPRDAARMLVVHTDGRLEHRVVRDLPDYLRRGDCIVFNDTKVIPARLHGHRSPRDGVGQGAKVEIMLHKRIASDRYLAFARPAKKLSPGDGLVLGENLSALVAGKHDGGEVEVCFALSGGELDGAIARQGEVPLPPYIAGKRKADERDLSDYQTLFAERDGSVAAPTAGLHFTPEMLAGLSDKGVGQEKLTLHVGAGTFLPVSAGDPEHHKMHSEWANVSVETAAALNAARLNGNAILAVGTTSLRTLETATGEDQKFAPFSGETDIFITPGYRFKSAEMLLTNFHLPRSTLFMLVSAFSGLDTMQRAYAEAIRERYRFYSYGDACLLMR